MLNLCNFPAFLLFFSVPFLVHGMFTHEKMEQIRQPFFFYLACKKRIPQFSLTVKSNSHFFLPCFCFSLLTILLFKCKNTSKVWVCLLCVLPLAWFLRDLLATSGLKLQISSSVHIFCSKKGGKRCLKLLRLKSYKSALDAVLLHNLCKPMALLP